MKTRIGILLMLCLAVIGMASVASAQAMTLPFQLQLQIRDSLIPMGTKVRVTPSDLPLRIVFKTVNSNSKFLVEKVSVISNRSIGSSQQIASFPISPEKQDNGFEFGGGIVSPLPQTITYSLEGIKEIRGDKSKKWNVALRERTFTLEYVR